MSDRTGNAALIEEFRARQSHLMIPSDLCTEHRISTRTVADVFVELMWHADETGRTYVSANTIARRLGFWKSDVIASKRVLVAAGFMTPVEHKRTRADEFQVQVGSWPGAVDNSHERSGERSGGRSGKRSGTPDPKGREEKIPRVGLRTQVQTAREDDRPRPDVTDPQKPFDGVLVGVSSPVCHRHPNGWHHDEPCGKCADARKFAESNGLHTGRPTPPKCSHGVPNGDLLAADGSSVGGCFECEKCPHGDNVRRCHECKRQSLALQNAVAAVGARMAL